MFARPMTFLVLLLMTALFVGAAILLRRGARRARPPGEACGQCGKGNPAGAQFCSHCGRALP